MPNYLLLSLAILLIKLQICSCLECYECNSIKSWEDCNSKKTSLTCPTNAWNTEQCYKINQTFAGVTTFTAGCLGDRKCLTSVLCPKAIACKGHCCGGKDLCNLENNGGNLSQELFPILSAIAVSIFWIAF